MPARYQRNGAVGTMTVAPFGNFYIGIVGRRCKVPASVAGWYFGFPKVGNELFEVEFAIEFVDFRNFLL